jgi:GNAT superfamily N-acetyltransferase
MNTDDILKLSDWNLAEFFREMTRWNAPGEILEQNDLLLTRGPGTFPSTNFAMYLGDGKDDPAAHVFERIRSFYRNRKSGFSIHIRRHADTALESLCQEGKMIRISDAPGMMVDRPFKDDGVPEGIEIHRIISVAGVIDFASVTIESYQTLGMPAHVGQQIFASPGRLLRPHNYLVVAYDAGQPVSAAMILFSHTIAGIYWVGTVEKARGRGLARACVRYLTNEAFRYGAEFVILQASKFGEPIYRRMGFTEFTSYPWYMFFIQ